MSALACKSKSRATELSVFIMCELRNSKTNPHPSCYERRRLKEKKKKDRCVGVKIWWRDANSESPRLPSPEPRRSTHVILSEPFKIPPTSSLIRYKRHSRRVVEKIGKWKKWWWTRALMKKDRKALQIINTCQIFYRWMNPHRSGTSRVFAAIVYLLLLSKILCRGPSGKKN